MQLNGERYYIVSWNNLGVEFFQEITEFHPDVWAKECLFDTIKTGKLAKGRSMGFDPNHLILRAQLNPQRHYEIYVFTSHDDVTSDDIKAWFDTDPQGFADWVRLNHSKKLFSNRKIKNDVIN